MIIKGGSEMDFNDYLQKALDEDCELKKEYNALQPEYEIIEKLVKVRIESKLTQKELAKKCGIKQSNISRLESGRANPTIKFLRKVADSLDCDLIVEFRKREPATETCAEITKNVVATVSFGATMKKFDRVGSSQKTDTHTMPQSMTLCTI